jgi:hypothetical protein
VGFCRAANALHPSARETANPACLSDPLIRNAGYDISFAGHARRPFMIAIIRVANDVTDLLRRILREGMK